MSDIRQKLAVVVPCYNAGDRARGVLVGAVSLLEHVIVVDDGSTDDLRQTIDDLNVRLLGFPANRGKGYALLAGFREAVRIGGLAGVLTMDADGQHDPAEIDALYQAFCRDRADLVIGARVFDASLVPWRSRFGNTLTIFLAGALLKKRLPDTQSGYRIHSMRFVSHLLSRVQGGRYETEMEILVRAVRDGFVVTSVPIRAIYEKGNKSSHFGVVRDSIRIWGKLLTRALSREVRSS